ncbi:TadE/TadG family type IV pilus assembly protein [Paenibacillus sp. FSL H8-0457]|uniref:TadE/TadG family type IV pilus assembly protein n=1 Tax=Paenibacillus TaxID=44249 RepID=UPI0003E1C281|nr:MULTISPECIES: TadE/TadG family type IV pilus assembly protein [Paenibacillus]ETT56599.1 TadE family protein [Paenibacillus sp. FSL H8-457]MCM3259900.1 pilus assembly protein [Paenibacillus lautus]
MNNRLQRRWKDETGSFTVEASLVLPIVLMLTVLLLFLCLYIYQQSMLVQASAAASERTAYSWDNSHKIAATGSVEQGRHDALYWRLTDDNVVGTLFGLAGGDSTMSIALPQGEAESGGKLPELKMSKGSTAVPFSMAGEMRYTNQLLIRKVTTSLNEQVSLTPISRMLDDGGQIKVNSQSIVVDPVEFIRTVDLMRYYGSKFQGGRNGTDKAAAGEVLQKFGGSR